MISIAAATQPTNVAIIFPQSGEISHGKQMGLDVNQKPAAPNNSAEVSSKLGKSLSLTYVLLLNGVPRTGCVIGSKAPKLKMSKQSSGLSRHQWEPQTAASVPISSPAYTPVPSSIILREDVCQSSIWVGPGKRKYMVARETWG